MLFLVTGSRIYFTEETFSQKEQISMFYSIRECILFCNNDNMGIIVSVSFDKSQSVAVDEFI